MSIGSVFCPELLSSEWPHDERNKNGNQCGTATSNTNGFVDGSVSCRNHLMTQNDQVFTESLIRPESEKTGFASLCLCGLCSSALKPHSVNRFATVTA